MKTQPRYNTYSALLNTDDTYLCSHCNISRILECSKIWPIWQDILESEF